MSLPYCEKHNVSWAAGKECPDCIADRLQTRVNELEIEVRKWMDIDNDNVQYYAELKFELRKSQEENAKLQKAADAANIFIESPNITTQHDLCAALESLKNMIKKAFKKFWKWLNRISYKPISRL
jgi:hypothetical protein